MKDLRRNYKKNYQCDTDNYDKDIESNRWVVP